MAHFADATERNIDAVSLRHTELAAHKEAFHFPKLKATRIIYEYPLRRE